MPLLPQSVKPRVILGLMTFGPPGSEKHDARIFDSETFNKALDVFQSKGYSEVDTARIYVGGQQEGWTGKETKWKERDLLSIPRSSIPRNIAKTPTTRSSSLSRPV
ncbi:hypothetical protein SNK04_003652 [Fusarium graminearum]